VSKKLTDQTLDALLDRQDGEAERALQLLYGELPAWFPMPRLEHARRIVNQLGNDGFTPDQIAKFAADEIADRLIVPGIVLDSVAFIHAVNELAHIKYALSLPDNECLEMLAGSLAVTGIKKSAQAKRFGQKGAKENKEKGEANRQAVLDAAREILAGRARKPSGRELAKLIDGKTGIPFNTVRGHLKHLRKDKILD
jgi:hypothetical protein